MMLVSDGHDAANAAADMKIGPGGTPPARDGAPVNQKGLPPEAEFIISALEAGAGGFKGQDRRKGDRYPYRVSATLKLYSDDPKAPPCTLFVRDVGIGGLGFVTRHRLPLGYGGVLTIRAPDGRSLSVDCTLLRCREAIGGWFEGSMYFNREQVAFEQRAMQAEER
jgi:hypothetical protein